MLLKWEDQQDWLRGRQKPGMTPGFVSWLTGWWSCTAFGYYCSSLLTCGERSLLGRHASNVYSSCQVLHSLHLVWAPMGVLRCPQVRAPNKSLTDFKILRTRSQHSSVRRLLTQPWLRVRGLSRGPHSFPPLFCPPLAKWLLCAKVTESPHSVCDWDSVTKGEDVA